MSGSRAFLAIVGPTAAGKSELAVEVALRLEGEVVSLDSRQVYRRMDIGTAKLAPAERRGVPHHGLDLIDPDQAYSAGRFARDARRWIREIRERGRVPVLVGGTGFFLRALTAPIFREPPLDPARRRALRRWLGARPRAELERWTSALDPERAALAAAGGPQRMLRALEVALLSGRPSPGGTGTHPRRTSRSRASSRWSSYRARSWTGASMPGWTRCSARVSRRRCAGCSRPATRRMTPG